MNGLPDDLIPNSELKELLSWRESIARDLAYWLRKWDAFTANTLASKDELFLTPIEECARRLAAEIDSEHPPIKPMTWLDPDGTVRTNIPPGHRLIREMRMVDGKPVCVDEWFKPEREDQQ